jgi:Tol biopolymer transport system component
MSDIAGGPNVVQLTPADVRATFVGLAEQDGATILYYLAPDQAGDSFNLEARDLATGETTTVGSTERAEDETYQLGRLSPDGRYVAWGNREGIDLLDLTTDGRRRILTGNRGACEGGALGDCYGYWVRAWSPDGRLLLVQKTFWEGGVSLVVDPFQECRGNRQAPVVRFGTGDRCRSPTSDAWRRGHYEAQRSIC